MQSYEINPSGAMPGTGACAPPDPRLEWLGNAAELAAWTDAHLVNRRDAFGHYIAVERRTDPEDSAITDKSGLTMTVLERHYRAASTGDVIGLHSTARDEPSGGDLVAACWSRWLGVDIDRHDDETDPEATLRAALALWDRAVALGFPALLLDSNGRGGYHLLLIFDGPVATEKVYAFGKWLTRDWKALGLDAEPEVFPKQAAIAPGGFGNWLRLPGHHHTRDHFTRVWDGSAWLDGAEAIAAILGTRGSPAGLIPAEALAPPEPPRKPKGPIRPGDYEKDAALAARALEYLDPSMSHDEWLEIGMALTPLGRDGLNLWDRWSAGCQEKYKEGLCDRKWRSFNKPSGGRTLGTLFHHAKARGFEFPKGPKPRFGRNGHQANGKAEANGWAGVPPDGDGSEVGNHGTPPPVNKAIDDPHRLARLFIKENFQHQDVPTLVHHRDEFHLWDGSAYRVYRDSQSDLVAGIEKEFNRINSEQIAAILEKNPGSKFHPGELPVAKKVTSSIVNNAMLALKSESVLSWDVETPCWLDAHEVERPDPINMLPTSNGLIDLATMTPFEPTPRFFSPFTLSYPYTPNASKPFLWTRFLHQLWPDDEWARRELQKWFGYFLTPDTRQQKIFLLLGPLRSGKGTIARVLERMIGEHNVASPTLASLTTNFGLWNLVGKTLAIVKDARLTGSSTDKAIVVERLLNISGEDAVDIDRKYQKPITTRLFSRIVIISNETPNFRDSSGALAGRMMPLKLHVSWFNKEDTNLTEKLYREMPGILEWAIEGRRMLEEDKRFFIPDSAKDLAEGMVEMTSPIKMFVIECCVANTADKRKPVDLEAIRDFFLAYKEWARLTGVEPGSENIFGRNLQAAYPHIKVERPRDGEEDRVRRYRGIELNDNGRKLRQVAIERNAVHPRGASYGSSY